jgi:hypothetical protein
MKLKGDLDQLKKVRVYLPKKYKKTLFLITLTECNMQQVNYNNPNYVSRSLRNQSVLGFTIPKKNFY